jgi:hypothetical protein
VFSEPVLPSSFVCTDGADVFASGQSPIAQSGVVVTAGEQKRLVIRMENNKPRLVAQHESLGCADCALTLPNCVTGPMHYTATEVYFLPRGLNSYTAHSTVPYA